MLSRGNLSPANHWSARGSICCAESTQAGMGKLDEADMLLGRSLIVEASSIIRSRASHSSSRAGWQWSAATAARAAQLFAEAGLLRVLLRKLGRAYRERAARLAQPRHERRRGRLSAAGAGRGLGASKSAAAHRGQAPTGTSRELAVAGPDRMPPRQFSTTSSRRLGEMRTGLPGVQLLYVQAATQLMRGKLEPGNELLLQALAAQAKVSLRNFQIGRTNEMYDSRVVSPRVAVDLYASLLADPTPADWVVQPLDAMAVLQHRARRVVRPLVHRRAGTQGSDARR